MGLDHRKIQNNSDGPALPIDPSSALSSSKTVSSSSRLTAFLTNGMWSSVLGVLGVLALPLPAHADDAAAVGPLVAKVEVREMASLERRSSASGDPRSVLPLILLSAEQRALRRTAASEATTSRETQARRIAARYSIMALQSIPLPEPDYWEVESARLAQPDRVDRPAVEKRNPWAAPDFVTGTPESRGFFHEDLVADVPRPVGARERGLERLIRKLGSRNLRKLLREDLRDRFEVDPSFHWLDYMDEKEHIWKVGRGDSHTLSFEQTQAEFRSGVANDPDELERRIDLIDWGPFRIDDKGSLGIDLKRMLNREARPDLELAPEGRDGEETPVGESLFSGRSVRVDTDLKFTPHSGALHEGEIREFFGKVRGSITLDFFDPMIHDRYMSTELEAYFKPNGDAAVFMNVILYGN